MKSRNSRRAWSRRSCPSRSSVRSTSDEIENPISPPNTTAYSVVRLCKPTMWLSKRRAAISAAARTGVALPSPTTANRFFIAPLPVRTGGGLSTAPFRRAYRNTAMLAIERRSTGREVPIKLRRDEGGDGIDGARCRGDVPRRTAAEPAALRRGGARRGGQFRHRLEGGGRARRLLPGDRDRALQKARS